MTDEREGFRRYCATCVNWKRRHNESHGACPIVGYKRHAAAIPCRAYQDNPELVKPETVIGYRVAEIVGDRMQSIWRSLDWGGMVYRLGERIVYPDKSPSAVFESAKDALAYCAAWSTSRSRNYCVLKVRGEVTHPSDTPYEPLGPGEKVWCSSNTPLAIVNEDGTEEGEEHRVVLTVRDADGSKSLYIPTALSAEGGGWDPLETTALKSWFGIKPEIGTQIEVTTRVLKRPEPKPERVMPRIRRLRAVVQCPKCEQDMAVDEGDCMPTACSACGVHFEEAPGA